MKTSNPHPARAVKSLGLRSRAGFMAQPVLRPREQEMAMIRRPMITGSRPLGTPMFLESKMAKTIRRRNMVDSTWSGRKGFRAQSVLCTCSPKASPSVKTFKHPGMTPRASTVESTCRGHGFSSRHLHRSSAVTAVPGNPMPSSDFHRPYKAPDAHI